MLLIFLMITISTGIKWVLRIILICISLLDRDVELFKVFPGHLSSSFEKFCFSPLPIFVHVYAESVYIVYAYMTSRLTSKLWTINKKAHQWEGQIPLSPAVNNCQCSLPRGKTR